MTVHSRFVAVGFAVAAVTLALDAGAQTTSLADAIRAGDRVTARSLLAKRPADARSAAADGTTPLHWAVQRDDLELVEALLKAGADATAANRYGATPLFVACQNGNAAVIERLLKAGADANAKNADGETMLMTAARTGKVEAVKLLLANGADPNDAIAAPAATASASPAATGGAIGNAVGGRLDAANGDPLTRLFQVFNTGSRATGRTGPGTSALIMAIMNGHFELAYDLVQQGADPNGAGPGWTPLHQLAWTRRPPIQHGLPPPVPTGSMDSLTLARALLEKGANPNARMTKEPADGARNILNRIGSTPFLQAAKLADVPYMKLLLEFKADPSINTIDGATPLMAAAGVGIWHTGESAGTNEEAFEAAKLLVELGNDVNAVDGNGDTALHGAALRGSKDIVKLLVSKGARLNVVNKIGWTPWIIADGVFYPNTYNRELETAALLLELGADKTVGKRRDVDLPPTEALASAGQAAR